MTTVLPPHPGVDQGHLVAWVAGYLAAVDTHEQGAYHAGYQQALHDICARIVEVEHLNRHLWDMARATARQRIAERRAAVETAARDMYAKQERAEYRGGAVDWDTGKPARTPPERRAA